MLRASTVFAVLSVVLIAAGCGGSHSTSTTTHGRTSTSTSTSPSTPGTTSTSTPPPSTIEQPEHFDAVVTTRLTSAASVPKGPPNASGTAVVKLNTHTRQACWTISVQGVQELLSAHVRKAPPGKVGPVLIPLGATFSRTGCVFVPSKAIRAIITSPRAYYVDVLARKYLDGALRGQLSASS